MEIERKFLVNHLPANLNTYPKKEIAQGYISTINPTIRIRRLNDSYILTIKSTDNIDADKISLINNEIEFNITQEKFDNLSTKVDGIFVDKIRYFIQLDDKHVAELDIYHNSLSPLLTVEVEFDNEQDALNFQPPEWFGLDVTDDIRYKNFHLSSFGLPN